VEAKRIIPLASFLHELETLFDWHLDASLFAFHCEPNLSVCEETKTRSLRGLADRRQWHLTARTPIYPSACEPEFISACRRPPLPGATRCPGQAIFFTSKRMGEVTMSGRYDRVKVGLKGWECRFAPSSSLFIPTRPVIVAALCPVAY
jgi:hypothetical protein